MMKFCLEFIVISWHLIDSMITSIRLYSYWIGMARIMPKSSNSKEGT